MRRVIPIIMALLLAVAACGGDATEDAAGDAGALSGGRDVYLDSCAVCHGQNGQGGVGNALDEVVLTFPDCEEQVRWITIGSSKWRDEVGPTYGAQGREIGGSMPGFDGVRSDAEIRAVAAYQRVAFGGQSEAAATAACGVTAG